MKPVRVALRALALATVCAFAVADETLYTAEQVEIMGADGTVHAEATHSPPPHHGSWQGKTALSQAHAADRMAHDETSQYHHHDSDSSSSSSHTHSQSVEAQSVEESETVSAMSSPSPDSDTHHSAGHWQAATARSEGNASAHNAAAETHMFSHSQSVEAQSVDGETVSAMATSPPPESHDWQGHAASSEAHGAASAAHGETSMYRSHSESVDAQSVETVEEQAVHAESASPPPSGSWQGHAASSEAHGAASAAHGETSMYRHHDSDSSASSSHTHSQSVEAQSVEDGKTMSIMSSSQSPPPHHGSWQGKTALSQAHAADRMAHDETSMYHHHDTASSQVVMTATGVLSMLGVVGMIGVVALKRERMSSASRESLVPFSKVAAAPNYGAVSTAPDAGNLV